MAKSKSKKAVVKPAKPAKPTPKPAKPAPKQAERVEPAAQPAPAPEPVSVVADGLEAVRTVDQLEKYLVDGIDITLPKFLDRRRARLEPGYKPPVPYEAPGEKRTWAPIRKYDDQPPTEAAPIFVSNRAAPVQVTINKDRSPLAQYANMDEFEAKHDRAIYPVLRTVDNAEVTIVLVGAKPWAGREKKNPSTPKVPREPGKLRGKAQIIADLLQRPEGCTTADILAATEWPAVSVPAQAKLAGLTLRKEKEGKSTRYWGSK